MLGGGLGNQLFRYAFARALQIKFYPDYKLILCTRAYRKLKDRPHQHININTFQCLRINDVDYTDKLPRDFSTFIKFCADKVRNHILHKLGYGKRTKFIDTKILQPISNIFGMYNPVIISEYIKPRRSYSKRILCNANFENPQYFDGIRDILLDEFTPKYDISDNKIELFDQITNSESVCVHIRRGDFLSPGNKAAFYVCNEEYFVKAMKTIHEEIPDCRFFVFSNDIEYVKQSMHLPFDVTYEEKDNPLYETLRFMYSCKHFIISNSTFSWWAQYLSRNENKIVYAPTPWHWCGEKWEGLYLPYMRTIECHKD